MKFETLMLQTLFTACLLICLLTLGNMLIASPSRIAASQAPVATATHAVR